MPPNRPRSLAEFLSRPGRALSALLERTRQTAEVTIAVREALPAELAGHVVAAAVRGAELIVYADAAVWAARLRFSEADLRSNLAPQQIRFRRLRLKVRPQRAAGPG